MPGVDDHQHRFQPAVERGRFATPWPIPWPLAARSTDNPSVSPQNVRARRRRRPSRRQKPVITRPSISRRSLLTSAFIIVLATVTCPSPPHGDNAAVADGNDGCGNGFSWDCIRVSMSFCRIPCPIWRKSPGNARGGAGSIRFQGVRVAVQPPPQHSEACQDLLAGDGPPKPPLSRKTVTDIIARPCFNLASTSTTWPRFGRPAEPTSRDPRLGRRPGRIGRGRRHHDPSARGPPPYPRPRPPHPSPDGHGQAESRNGLHR